VAGTRFLPGTLESNGDGLMLSIDIGQRHPENGDR
jgi:hypothetical protein